MTDPPPRRPSGTMRIKAPTSVSDVLENMRIDAVEQMLKRLDERPGLDSLDPSEIQSIARIAGLVAKTVAADAVGVAFQMGIDRSVKDEEHEAVTVRAQTPPGGTPQPKG